MPDRKVGKTRGLYKTIINNVIMNIYMADNLTLDDIDKEIAGKIYTQDYSKKPVIEGVKIGKIVINIGEEGDFSEILKVNSDGEVEGFPNFKIAQVNRTQLNVNAVKAWHIHLVQDEVWYIMPSDTLLVGLWDIRKNSKTAGHIMRIVLGGTFRLLFVPRGVAHGCANVLEKPVQLFYFTNAQFNRGKPDEMRIAWDAQGKEFWTPQRD